MEVRSSAEASVSGTDRGASLRQSRENHVEQVRQSKEKLRTSQENPIREVEERVSIVEKPEVARNTEEAAIAEESEEYGS